MRGRACRAPTRMADLLAQMQQLREMHAQLLREQEEAQRVFLESQEAARKAKEEYERVEAARKAKGDTVDAYQANIREMAKEYENYISAEAAEAAAQAQPGADNSEEEGSDGDREEDADDSHEIDADATATTAAPLDPAELPNVPSADRDAGTSEASDNRSDQRIPDAASSLKEQNEGHETVAEEVIKRGAAGAAAGPSTPSLDVGAGASDVSATAAQAAISSRQCTCILSVVEAGGGGGAGGAGGGGEEGGGEGASAGSSGSGGGGHDSDHVAAANGGEPRPRYVLERHNNIGQYVLYIQTDPATRFVAAATAAAGTGRGQAATAAAEPFISVTDGGLRVEVRIQQQCEGGGGAGESSSLLPLRWASVRLHLRTPVVDAAAAAVAGGQQCSATASPDGTCLVLKLRWAGHTSDHAMMLTDFGDSRPARVEGGAEASGKAWAAGDVHCRFCGHTLARPGAVTRALPLPSANWGEMMDALLCHAHGAAVADDDDDENPAGGEGEGETDTGTGGGGGKKGDGNDAAGDGTTTAAASAMVNTLLSLSGTLNAKEGMCLVGPT